MNRLLAACLVLVTLAPAPLAAEEGAAAATPDLAGKAVIVQRANWYIGVRENVRFATVGNHSFIIIPRPNSDAEQWDQWMPLDKIEGIKVFDTADAAVAYAQKVYPQYEKPEQAQIPADATTSRTIRVDGDASPAADAPKQTADSEDGATLSGVVTLKGQPVTGRLFFHTSGDQFFGCRIDEQGRYTVTAPKLGDYRVTIEGPGVPSRYSRLDSGLRVIIGGEFDAVNIELLNP